MRRVWGCGGSGWGVCQGQAGAPCPRIYQLGHRAQRWLVWVSDVCRHADTVDIHGGVYWRMCPRIAVADSERIYQLGQVSSRAWPEPWLIREESTG